MGRGSFRDKEVSYMCEVGHFSYSCPKKSVAKDGVIRADKPALKCCKEKVTYQ